MPAKKTTKQPARKTTKKAEPVQHSCEHCEVMPLRSGELVAILLCLVFSLSAVLMTSLLLIEDQQHELTQYEQLMIRR